MEECAGDAGGDGDQFLLALEDFDKARAGEFRKVDGAAGADAEDCRFIGGDRGEVWEELAGVDEEGCCPVMVGESSFVTGLSARFGMTGFCVACHFFFDCFERVGLTDLEFGDGGAAER